MTAWVVGGGWLLAACGRGKIILKGNEKAFPFFAIVRFFFVFLHPMGRYVRTLLLLLTILLAGSTNLAASNNQLPVEDTSAKYVIDNGKATCAVIANAQNLVRICSSRPQRVLPSYIGKPERTDSREPVSFHHQQFLNHLTEWEVKPITSPFPPVVSSDYFVYALRRLLC